MIIYDILAYNSNNKLVKVVRYMNLVKLYCESIKNNLNQIISIMMPAKHQEYKKLINIYLNLYIKIRFFHEPETVTKEDLENYDFQTIIREFNGKRIELLYEYKQQDQFQYAKYVEDAYTAVATAVLLNGFQSDLITVNNIKKVVDDAIPILLSDQTIDNLCQILLKNKEKESKLLNRFVTNQFYLKYQSFRFCKTFFKVELHEKIDELNGYDIHQISKNMNREPICSLAIETLVNLLSVDMISLMKANEELASYFITMPSTLWQNKTKLDEIFKLVDFSFVKKHLIWLIMEKDYLENKELICKISQNNSFALVIDMQNEEAIDSKLDSYIDNNDFNYIVCKNATKDQYTQIVKYSKLVNKPIFTDELVKE